MPASLTSLVEKIRAQAARDRNLTATLRSAVDAVNTPAPPPPPRLVPLLRVASYGEDDALGYYAALMELLPLIGLVGMGAWLVARREVRTAWGLCGLVLSAALSSQAAPTAGALSPSGHVQAIAYLACWSFLSSWRRLSRTGRFASGCAAVALVGGVARSRVYLSDDSPEQAAVGAMLGGCAAALCFVSFVACGRASLRPLVESRLGRSLLLRDSSHVPDLLAAELEWLRSMRQAKVS